MNEPIVLNAYRDFVSSGQHYFQRKASKKPPLGSKDETELLKSVRSALLGAGKDADPNFRSVISPTDDGLDGGEELTWDEHTVVWSIGGVLKQKWDLSEEGQRVQYACFGLVLTEGTVHMGSHSSGSAARYTSYEEDATASDLEKEQKQERSLFNPFFVSRKARMKSVEPTALTKGVFIFLRNLGKVFLANGLGHTFSLPFIVQHAWPLSPHGVLLERVIEPSELLESDPLPSLYSLTSPFQEPRPIGRVEDIKGGYDSVPAELPNGDSDGNYLNRTIHAGERIVWISLRIQGTTDTLFVTLNHDERRLSFWRYVYIPPEDTPVPTADRQLGRRGGSLGSERLQIRITSQSGKDMVARNDRIREPSPELGEIEDDEFSDIRPSLPAISGISPVLPNVATLVSMNAGSVATTPYYWAEHLYEVELNKEDIDSWSKITASVFDHRSDGTQLRSLVAFSLPSSKNLDILSLYSHPETQTYRMDFLVSHKSVISAVSLKSTRRNIWDLLVLKATGELAILTFNLLMIPVHVNRVVPGNYEASVYDVSMDPETSFPSSPDALSPRIVGFSNPLVTTVTLIYEDGSKSCLSVDLVPTDFLTQRIVFILSAYCKSDDFLKIYTRFLQLWCSKNKSSLATVQFDCIAEAMLGNWGISWRSTEQPDAQDASSPWASLISSASHSRLRDDAALLNIIPQSKPPEKLSVHGELSRSGRSALNSILQGLHVLGEEMRLVLYTHESLLRLSTLTARLAQLVRPAYFDFLKRLYPSSLGDWTTDIEFTLKDEASLPLDIASSYYARLSQPELKSPAADAAMNRQNLTHAFGGIDIHPVYQEFAHLFTTLSDNKNIDTRKRAENAVLMMAQHQIGLDYMNLLPLCISVPLREAARTCQLGPPPDWPASAYEFVGRTDLTESGKINGDLTFNDGYKSIKEHLKSTAPRKTFRALIDEAHRVVHHGEEAVTGVELEITDLTDVRFGQDRRIQEVARMLRSSNVPSIRMVDRPDLNEHELAKEQQMQVLRTAERTLALPIGRAMFTFATVPTVTREGYSVPKIELTIRLQPQNICIGPEPGKIPIEAVHWAEFHNGVAAALRISPTTGSIDSSWISFNRPSDLTAEHAGFLYGLGLTGHLKEMLTWCTFGYLTPKHDLTSIGILLGLAASFVGSRNKNVMKLFSVHTPALLPAPDVELNVPLITQAASLLGIGLIYMASKNRRFAEVALSQIGRPDLSRPDISNENREAYTVSAALSFGMIMLGRGMATTSPADVVVLSRLQVLIHGEGPATLQTKSDKASFDVNLTSPAATMALGLMYLKTDRQDVADILVIPDAVSALNHIQPNFLLVRTIARNLIMWSKIKSTRDWLIGQIPQPILRVMDTRVPYQMVDEAIELAYYHITAGAVFSLALKYAGTANREAYSIISEFYEFFRRSSLQTSPAYNHRIKRAATRDGLSLVTLSMGIVMAGTGELSCLKRLRLAHGMYNQPIRYGSHMSTHMALGLLFLGEGRYSLGNSDASIACMVTAFYPHFPALSSDTKSFLPALRHLWVLAAEPRCLIARDVDTKEVVYLPMKVRVKDEDGAINGTHLVAPTLIPMLDRLQSIKIDTPRYWPFLVDIASNPGHRNNLLQSQTIFVKRRTMFLSYTEDPKGSRSLFVRSGMSTGDAATLDNPQFTMAATHPASDIQHYITSHSNDVLFLAFADRLSRTSGFTEDEKTFNAFCHAALLDCIIQDKPQMLSSYLVLYRARVISPRSRHFHLVQQDLLRINDFYNRIFERRFSGRQEGINRPSLLRESSISGAVLTADVKLRVMAQKPEFRRAILAYVRNHLGSPDMKNSEEFPYIEQDLAWYLLRHSVPYSAYLPKLREIVEEATATYSNEIGPDSPTPVLHQGMKLVLHACIAAFSRPFGHWSMESLIDILPIWFG